MSLTMSSIVQIVGLRIADGLLVVFFALGDACFADFLAGLGDFVALLPVDTVLPDDFAGVVSAEAVAFFGEVFFVGEGFFAGVVFLAGDTFLTGDAFFAGAAFFAGSAFFLAGEAFATRPALTLPSSPASCALTEGVARRGEDLVALADIGDLALLALAGVVAARAFAMFRSRRDQILQREAVSERSCCGNVGEAMQSGKQRKGIVLRCNQS